MAYKGTVRNGLVELEPGAHLPEGTIVRVEPAEPESAPAKQQSDIPSLFLAGRDAVHTGIPDLATNIDHYLYGHPKVSNGR